MAGERSQSRLLGVGRSQSSQAGAGRLQGIGSGGRSQGVPGSALRTQAKLSFGPAPAPAPHVLDANTIGLWRLDEASDTDPMAMVDEQGNLDLYSLSGYPEFYRDGLGSWCRGLIPTFNQCWRSVVHAPTAAMLVGDFTIEAWIWIDSGQVLGTVMTLISYGQTGETLATNYLIRIQATIGVGGLSASIALLWEYDLGINVDLPTAAVVGVDGWHHLAISCVVTGMLGLTRTVTTYVDGVAVAPVAGTNAEGGTSALWRIGIDVTVNPWTKGKWGEVCVSNVARSGAEIAVNAASPTRTHTVDANTYNLWTNRAPPTAEDLASENHLVYLTSAPAIVPGLIGGNARQFDGTLGRFLIRQTVDAASTAFKDAIRNGDWTIEAWVEPVIGQDSYAFGIIGEGDVSSTQNQLCELFWMATQDIYCLWEHGVGVNEIMTFGVPVWVGRKHLAITVTGAGVREVKFYVDGVNVSTQPGITRADGGAAASIVIGHPGGGVGSFATVASGYGIIDDVRVSNIARTPAEILFDATGT